MPDLPDRNQFCQLLMAVELFRWEVQHSPEYALVYKAYDSALTRIDELEKDLELLRRNNQE